MLRPVSFVCVRAGSGPHTLSMLCFKPCMENESDLALDTLNRNASWIWHGPKPCPAVLSAHRAQQSSVLLLPHPAAPPALGCVWWKCQPRPLGHCRHLTQELLLPVYLLLMGWASKAWDLERNVVGRMKAWMPFAPLSPPGSQPCLSLTEVFTQCLGIGCVWDSGSLCLSAAQNIDVPIFS